MTGNFKFTCPVCQKNRVKRPGTFTGKPDGLHRSGCKHGTNEVLAAFSEKVSEPDSEPGKASGTVFRRSELSALPKPDPLINGIISKHGVVLLVGQYGAGKTFLSLSMALSIGTGHQWLGRDVEQSPVLFVVGEGAHGLDKRVAAWE